MNLKNENRQHIFHCYNDLDKYVYSSKPLINDTNLSKYLEEHQIKYDKETFQLLNFILIKFTRIFIMEVIENKFFEKSRNNYTYRNKSVSAKHIIETFYSLPEFEMISKLMDINKISTSTLEPMIDTILKKIQIKKEMGSSRLVQLNDYFLKDDDDNNNNDNKENNNNINPILYNQIDNYNNFLKKTKYSNNTNDNNNNNS